MKHNNETGHAINVANFGKLVSFCNGYGTDYNPSNADIKINTLTAIQTDSQNAINSVNECLPAYNNAIAAREIAFKPLSKHLTRVMNALKAASPNPAITAKAAALVRKLQGRRLSSGASEQQDLITQDGEVKRVSSSQLGFDKRINNLDKLINLLGSIPEYNPNETELQLATLKTLLDDLRVKNNAVIEALTPLSNARIARNNMLYNNGEGLVDKALNVKAYVKSLYGASSPQFHQISGLEFKRFKI